MTGSGLRICCGVRGTREVKMPPCLVAVLQGPQQAHDLAHEAVDMLRPGILVEFQKPVTVAGGLDRIAQPWRFLGRSPTFQPIELMGDLAELLIRDARLSVAAQRTDPPPRHVPMPLDGGSPCAWRRSSIPFSACRHCASSKCRPRPPAQTAAGSRSPICRNDDDGRHENDVGGIFEIGGIRAQNFRPRPRQHSP